MLKLIIATLTLAACGATANAEEVNTPYPVKAAVVLPVFYVVDFNVEGYKIHVDDTANKVPTPTIVYAPKKALEGEYSAHTISPTLLLKKLTEKIDAQLDTKP